MSFEYRPDLLDGDGLTVRTILGDDGEPWFVAADVCAVLGLPNVSMALSRLDEDDISTADVILPYGTSGATRKQAVKIVSEAGLYELVFQSRKPEAKAFKRWVTHEVLPTIRKTGGAYVRPGSQAELDLTDPDTALDKLAEVVEIARQARAELATVKPRALGAIGSEDKRGGQAVWDLRDAISEAVGCGSQDAIAAVAALGAIEKRGTTYSVRAGWDDVLFASETKVPNPKGGEPYTYNNGTIRVVPGKQVEFLDRLRRANERRIFGD